MVPALARWQKANSRRWWHLDAARAQIRFCRRAAGGGGHAPEPSRLAKLLLGTTDHRRRRGCLGGRARPCWSMMVPQSVRSLAGGPAAMVAPGVNTVGLDGDAKALEVLMHTLSPRAAS